MADISNTDAAAVIEEVVSRVVQETLIQESVLIPAVKDMSSMVRDGMDTLKIPKFSALSVVSKGEDTCLTPAVPTIATDDLVLDQHNAIAWSLEDRTEIQSAVDIISQLVRDSSRSLAASVDDCIVTELLSASAAAPDHRQQFANTPTDTIQEADILEARRLLDIQNVPSSDRFMLLPPDQEKAMLQIANFIQADRYGSAQPIQNGEIGMVFGIRVLKTTSSNLGSGEFVAFHRDAVAYASQRAARLEQERNVLCLKTDYVLSMLFGCQVLDGGKRQVLFNATGA